MATAIMENYEIGHNLKTIQVRDPYFQGYGMQWNYDFHSEITATTTKSNVVAVVAITPNYEIGHNLKSMQINLFVCVCGTFSKMAQHMDTKLYEPTVLIPGKGLHQLWGV